MKNNDFLAGKRLLIFDCDGVLIDANQANLNFFNECLRRGGHPPLAEELHEKVVYQSTKQLMSELFPDPAEAGRMHRISQDTDYTPFLDDVRPLFDYDRVLGSLHEKFRLAVATNRGRSLDRLFRHFRLDTWFEFRVSVLEAEPKPHPEMLLKCVGHFGVSKAEALYLGDSVTDHEAAVNAGIDYLWVGGKGEPGIGSVAELADLP